MSINIFNILGGGNNPLIPDRNPSFVTGSTFINNNINLTGLARENNVFHELSIGNLPNFLRSFVPVTVTSGTDKLTYIVMPDVICIGSDEDYVRMPMSAPFAKKIADQFDCTLPTKKMCDQIWKAASIKLDPHPRGAPYDSSMMATTTFNWHNSIIENQLQGQDKTKLITGHKKDVIIDKNWFIRKDRVVIYGWFSKTGVPIQGPQPNCLSHELTYLDYSHSIRLIAQDVILNGQPMRFFDILNDSKLSYLISEEGPFDATSIYK